MIRLYSFILNHLLRQNNTFHIYRTVRFTIQILTSYNNHIGNATNDNVNISDVGVITAATIRIITTA